MLHGLKIAAVAVVAQAVWGMGRSLCPDRPRLTLMALSCASVLAWPTAWTQVAVIAGAGLAGRALLKTEAVEGHERLPIAIGYRGALLFLTLFAVLLVCLPLAARLWPEQWLRLLDAFYRAGSLVFGGGHVVLPLLQAEVVPKGWVDGDTFLAGYAAAQAVPGPLFTFAAFLGAASGPAPNGWSGALLCLLAIFLPSFLLVAGALPFWDACATNAGYGQRWPGSTRRWSACCWRRCTSRSGPKASCARPTSPCCSSPCWPCSPGRRRPGKWCSPAPWPAA